MRTAFLEQYFLSKHVVERPLQPALRGNNFSRSWSFEIRHVYIYLKDGQYEHSYRNIHVGAIEQPLYKKKMIDVSLK